MKPQVELGPPPPAPLGAERSTAAIPRNRAALWAAGLIGALLVLVAFSRVGIAAFAMGQPRTIPTMLAAALLALASGSAWLLGRGAAAGGSRGMAAWRAAAALLAVLAVEQATSLHFWAAEWLELPSFSLVELPALIGVVAIAIGSRLLRSGPSQALWVTGGAAWLGAQIVEAALSGRWQHGVSASLELLGCALLALALLLALPPGSRPWEARGDRGGPRRLAESAVGAVSVGTAARGLGAAIGLFALLGGLLIVLDGEFLGPVQDARNPLQWFDLNQELTFPAYFSGLLLLSMAGLAILVARTPKARLGSAWPWWGMALIVAFLAVDEIVDFHGRVQGATHIEAQVFLAPVMVTAAIVGLVLLFRVRRNRAVRWMFIGGAAAWGLAMAIDPSTHPGSSLAFPEELLEMTGSALFLVALLSLARSGLGLDRGPAATADDAVAH
jgi:hypothetical protein